MKSYKKYKQYKTAVIVFPGTNCDNETCAAIEIFTGIKPDTIHSYDRLHEEYELIVLPGGFSYGDYLRPGAISSMLPLLDDIREHANRGGLLLGICNGFQILTECNILPGILMKNDNSKFICKDVSLSIKSCLNSFTSLYFEEDIILPIAHGYGKYFCDNKTLDYLRSNKMIAFEYKENVNGSVGNIAGITNEKGNVLGMMPHPERAVFPHHTNGDGILIFVSALRKWASNDRL